MKTLLKRKSVGDRSPQSRVHRMNFEAAMRYHPKPYPGVVTNLKPRRNYSALPDPDMGWKGLALEGVANIDLDLNPHAMMSTPFIEQLADQLAHLLSATESHREVRLRVPLGESHSFVTEALHRP